MKKNCSVVKQARVTSFRFRQSNIVLINCSVKHVTRDSNENFFDMRL